MMPLRVLRLLQGR